MEKEEELRELYKQLNDENKSILNLVAKAISVAQNENTKL